MLITAPTYCLVEPASGDVKLGLAHKIAPTVDLILGIAVLVIGLLGLYGITPSLTHVAPYLVGTGAAYAGSLILGMMFNYKQAHCPNYYLFKDKPTNENT